MALLRFVPVLVLSGCFSIPNGAHRPTESEDVAVSATVDAWQQLDLPYGERCQDERALLRVLVADDEELRLWCSVCRPGLCGRDQEWDSRQCPWGCGAGCMTYWDPGVWPLRFFGTRTPALILHESVQAPERLTVHETAHWLERCGLHLISRDHDDPRIWIAAGGRDTVQGRALAAQ